MPAPPSIDRDQPSFLRFPLNNDRTGFQPVFLPLVLVVPRRKTASGSILGNSGVFDVRYFIQDAPNPSKVAGPFNDGLLVPQLSRFVINVTQLELSDIQIDPQGRKFFDSVGVEKDFEDVINGDLFEYTLIRGGTTSTIPYFKDADYYDMSLFTIDVEDLPRPDRYFFIWEAKYYRRVSLNTQLASSFGDACISDDIGIARFRLLINHPGEVHHEMFKRTPPFYFDNENFRRADDPILRFYRPFADILQDMFDEQTLLNGINHIDKIPAQLIPYLAFLIGWDLPNFPGVTDTVRRSILRQAVRLQQLKGSRRALIELFDIFGFSIDLLNLWYTKDGARLAAPGERLPDTISDQEIKIEKVCQTEPLVADYSTPGFGEFEVPLIHKSTGNITLIALLVKDGQTRNVLNSIVEDGTDNPDILETSCPLSGPILPNELLSRLPVGDPTLIATSEILVDFNMGLGTQIVSTSPTPIINQIGVTYDNLRNIVKVNFDHHLDFSDSTKIFIFAKYPRDKIVIPDALKNLRSNRFDVRIFLKDGQEPSPELLEFLLQFVFKLKAFHSLLRKIVFDLVNLEVYNVQDLCFGTQLQGPPPVNQGTADPCSIDSATQGLKTSDINLRNEIFHALVKEHETWKSLDNTHISDIQLDKLLNLPVTKPEGSECQFTQVGQDRVLSSPDVDFDQQVDQRPKLCDTNAPPLLGNCFKGRVKDDLNSIRIELNCEIVRSKPCPLGMGYGSYWLYPSDVRSILRDGFGKFKGQNLKSFVGKQISEYNHPIPFSLHYTDRLYLSEHLRSDRFLAYRKPSLEIQKDNFLFPSHRQPGFGNLLNDFTHPLWHARPWDNNCEPLNARLIDDSLGDQILVFDDALLVYFGNGLQADVSSHGSHDNRSYVVTHKIYLVSPPSHPAIIDLDSTVVLTQDESITFDSSVPFGPIFRSFNETCNTDFRSGYPAEFNEFDFNIDDIDFNRDNDSNGVELSELLELPIDSNDGSTATALFTYGSQILVTPDDTEYGFYIPYRYDCDCSRFGCGSSGFTPGSELNDIEISRCSLEHFRNRDGNYDFNCDQLDIINRVKLIEKVGICSDRFDGGIPNMLCVLDDGLIPDNILPSGSFKIKDTYGTIFEGAWTFINDILDITTIEKIPYVWGEKPQGFIRGHAVFKRGIVITTRQIIKINQDGTYIIEGTGSEQKIEFFQTNLVCGNRQFKDEFCHHCDCIVSDDILGIVTCGTRWTDVDDTQVAWGTPITDSSGNVVDLDYGSKQPFIFMDVWNDEGTGNELTAICPVESGSS